LAEKIDDLRHFKVFHEKGGFFLVLAKNETDAIEQYYHSLESIIGHQLKICGCFGERKPIDRNEVLRPVKVEAA